MSKAISKLCRHRVSQAVGCTGNTCQNALLMAVAALCRCDPQGPATCRKRVWQAASLGEVGAARAAGCPWAARCGRDEEFRAGAGGVIRPRQVSTACNVWDELLCFRPQPLLLLCLLPDLTRTFSDMNHVHCLIALQLELGCVPEPSTSSHSSCETSLLS